jgi:hypothetical protein
MFGVPGDPAFDVADDLGHALPRELVIGGHDVLSLTLQDVPFIDPAIAVA